MQKRRGSKVKQCVEYLNNQLHELLSQLEQTLESQVAGWLNIGTPKEMQELEEEIMKKVAFFAGKLVGAILEAIHLNSRLVIKWQRQASRSGLSNIDWRKVELQTLGGAKVTIETPYARRRTQKKKVGRTRKKRGAGGSGDYPVLRAYPPRGGEAHWCSFTCHSGIIN